MTKPYDFKYLLPATDRRIPLSNQREPAKQDEDLKSEESISYM